MGQCTRHLRFVVDQLYSKDWKSFSGCTPKLARNHDWGAHFSHATLPMFGSSVVLWTWVAAPYAIIDYLVWPLCCAALTEARNNLTGSVIILILAFKNFPMIGMLSWRLFLCFSPEGFDFLASIVQHGTAESLSKTYSCREWSHKSWKSRYPLQNTSYEWPKQIYHPHSPRHMTSGEFRISIAHFKCWASNVMDPDVFSWALHMCFSRTWPCLFQRTCIRRF